MASAKPYEIRFKNSTNTVYHFGVYQAFPSSPGLKSVIWQVKGLGPNAQNKVNWRLQYGAVIAEWNQNERSYSGLQIVNAGLGNAYQVNIQQGDIPVINPMAMETDGLQLSPDQIKLYNNTLQRFDLGLAVDGKLAAVTSTTGNQWANYIVRPTYYVALYRNAKPGHLIDNDLQVGPVRVEFPPDNYTAMVECVTESGRDVLKASLIYY